MRSITWHNRDKIINTKKIKNIEIKDFKRIKKYVYVTATYILIYINCNLK